MTEAKECADMVLGGILRVEPDGVVAFFTFASSKIIIWSISAVSNAKCVSASPINPFFDGIFRDFMTFALQSGDE